MSDVELVVVVVTPHCTNTILREEAVLFPDFGATAPEVFDLKYGSSLALE